MGKIWIPLILFLLGNLGCQGKYTLSAPNLGPTMTFTSTPGTVTATSTFTGSPTFTRTFTPMTSTGSPTTTPTATWTPTETSTHSPTNTPNTPTNTATNSPTGTVTAVVTPPLIRITMGSSAPPNSAQYSGTANVPVLQINLNNQSNAPTTMTSLKVTASGTGNDATDISAVKLYLDANGNGIVDGGDSLLGSSTYSSDNGTALIAFNNVLPAFGNANYLVVYDFGGLAPNGYTYQASIASNNDLTGVDGTFGLPVLFTGAPQAGALISITDVTPTSTRTPTPSVGSTTFTPTPTFTGSPTQTFTSTPTVTSTLTGSPTPNMTACVTTGNTNLVGLTFSSVPVDNFISGVYTLGSSCGGTLSEAGFYASDSSAGSVELSVYDFNGNRIFVQGVPVPSGPGGWVTVGIPSVAVSCGNDYIVSLHSFSSTLMVGEGNGNSCRSDSGTYIGNMPSPYLHPGIFSYSAGAYCPLMYLVTCP